MSKKVSYQRLSDPTLKEENKKEDSKNHRKIDTQPKEHVDEFIFIPTISPKRISKSIANLEQMILDFELALGLSNGISEQQLDKLLKKFENIVKSY